MVVVLGTRRRDLQKLGSVLRCWAEAGRADWRGGGRKRAPAEQSCLELLIRRQFGNIHNRVSPVRPVVAITARARCGTGDQTAVITPIETNPGSPLGKLILQVSCLIEPLIVVDTKYAGSAHAGRRGSDSADLRLEEARRHAGHHHERREAVVVRHASADGKSWDFRPGPLDGKRDGR